MFVVADTAAREMDNNAELATQVGQRLSVNPPAQKRRPGESPAFSDAG